MLSLKLTVFKSNVACEACVRGWSHGYFSWDLLQIEQEKALDCRSLLGSRFETPQGVWGITLLKKPTRISLFWCVQGHVVLCIAIYRRNLATFPNTHNSSPITSHNPTASRDCAAVLNYSLCLVFLWLQPDIKPSKAMWQSLDVDSHTLYDILMWSNMVQYGPIWSNMSLRYGHIAFRVLSRLEPPASWSNLYTYIKRRVWQCLVRLLRLCENF